MLPGRKGFNVSSRSSQIHLEKSTSPTIFDRELTERPEIIEGLIREGQLAILVGTYGLGKSPLVQDLCLHLAFGEPWCGRKLEQRPVLYFDFESPAVVVKSNIERLAARKGFPVPNPDEIKFFLEHDEGRSSPSTASLHAALRKGRAGCMSLLRLSLFRSRNALIVIDPLDSMFPIDKRLGLEVLHLYYQLRGLIEEFPEVSILTTFNLRKRDRKAACPDLLSNPRDFLSEVSGANELLTRSDVRLGMDFHPRNSDIRVLNGIRRGEDLHPLLLESVLAAGGLAGFEQITPEVSDLVDMLTPKQYSYWRLLPDAFTFEEAARTVPKVTLKRILDATSSLKALHKSGNRWVKSELTHAPIPLSPVAPVVPSFRHSLAQGGKENKK